MTGLRVLVAGGTGKLGREVVAVLASRGARVRVLTRRKGIDSPYDVFTGDALRPETIAGCCDDIDVVFSALGQSVQPALSGGRASFRNVDLPANLNLLHEALSAGVKRFVYVSLFGANELGALDYVSAHEGVVRAIKAAGPGYAIVRPTGFFSAFDSFLDLARKDQGIVFGNGSARSNPIDDRDLAVICADLVEETENGEIEAGGPDVLTRRDLVELAYAAVDRPVKIRSVPAWLPSTIAKILQPINPRLAALAAFYVAVGTRDFVAPRRGTRTIGDYFREIVRSKPRNRPPG